MNSAEQYVRMTAEMVRDASGGARHGDRHGKERGWMSVMEFVALHGREWTWQPKPKHIRRGTIKMCFENAYRLARRDRSLTYVEGYATRIIPVHHAWVVSPEGIVIDNTWAEVAKFDGDRAYFGVAFDLAYVTKRRKEMARSGGISILDDYANKFPTLRTDFSYNQKGVRPVNF